MTEEIKAKLDWDVVDSIVYETLLTHASYLMEEGNDKYELLHNKARLFASFCEVLEYFGTKVQYNDFLESTKGKKVE